MDYKIFYLQDADSDLDDIAAYLSQFYTGTFPKFMDTLEKGIVNLQSSPYLGMPYHSYRKLVLGEYLVLYKVDEERNFVKIYRILHGAKNNLSILEKL